MTFIIAEIGASHCGSLDTAKQLVTEAAKAGADSVKLQTFSPVQMAIPGYKIQTGPWAGKDLRGLYEKTVTPREWHEEIFQLIRDEGMEPMSTPFHPDDVEFLESIGCEKYKIASFEATDLQLLEAVADTGKEMYISTGQVSDSEIDIILDHLFGHRLQITLMHCISEYPADMSQANLGRLRVLRRSGSVGLSDHTKGVGAAPLAVALGACAIEKHIQLCPVLGEDRKFALLPHEFGDMVRWCRDAESAMEAHHPTVQQPARELKRSVWCKNPKQAGEPYLADDLVVCRPWSGVSALDYEDWLGQPCSEGHEAWHRPR